MKIAHITSFLSIALLLGSTISPQAKNLPPTTQLLIEKLAADNYQDRQDAMDELWRLGKSALPSLEQYFESDEPEIAARAQVLARNIQAGILPDTPKEIADLVAKYNKSKHFAEKNAIMRRLREMEAFKQMLFMLSWETDPAMKKQMQNELANISLLAARKAMAEDDIDEAISLLREAGKLGSSMKPLAHLLYYTGKLDAELAAQAALPANQQSRDWQLQLLLTKGDKKAARVLAKAMNNQGVIALLNLLEGNAHDILNLIATQESKSLPPGVTDHLIRYCLGKPRDDAGKFVNELTQNSIDAAKENDAMLGLRGLFLTGNPKEGAKVLAQRSPLEGFLYYNSSDKSQPALASLGIPDPEVDKDAYLAWVKSHTDKLINDNDEDEHLDKEKEILVAFNFLYSRGEQDLAKATIKPMLDHFIKDGSDQWFTYLSIIAQEGMPEYTIELALERGNEDNAFERTLDSLGNESPSRTLIWNALGLRHPKDPRQQFTEMAMLLGVWRDKRDEVLKLEDSLSKEAANKGVAARTEMLAALSSLALERTDYLSAYKYSKELHQLIEKPDPKSPQWSQHRVLAEVLMDWPEIIKLYKQKSDALQKSPSGMVKYALALRKIGREEEGDKWLEKAITLSLGNLIDIADISSTLRMAGYSKGANELLLRHLLCTQSPNKIANPEFIYIVNQLNDANSYFLKSANWQQASALFSVEAMSALCSDSERVFSPIYFQRLGFNIMFSNGMLALENGQKQVALKRLKQAHDMMVGDGYLADYFFPALRQSGLSKEYDEWFNESWQTLLKEIQRYPNSHNTHNTIAWLGARSVRNLDESLKHIQSALAIKPHQGAYVDTLAEVHFSKGNRDLAIEKSQMAVEYVVDGSLAFSSASSGAVINTYWDLKFQLNRFREDPFPISKVQPMKRKSIEQN